MILFKPVVVIARVVLIYEHISEFQGSEYFIVTISIFV